MIEGIELTNDDGKAPVLEDDFRRSLTWTMAEFFRYAGYTDIKARLPGFPTTSLLSGTIQDHRPDLTCRQPDKSKTPLVLDSLDPTCFGEDYLSNRWTLFKSARQLYRCEFHIVVPRWDPLVPSPEGFVRKLAEQLEFVPNKVWTV